MHAECVPLNTQVDEGVVSRIIDGDTIEVLINGQPYRIRYIGMDTPDTNHPTKGLERLGLEAAEMNRQMVEGKPVLLVKDVSETDRYDRLLRYIIVDENNAVFVNYELARQGYAYASSYPPDVACDQTFLVAHQSAMQEKIGLWAPTPIPSLTPASRLPEVTSAIPITGSDCDPAYPTVCIPPSPPDLDCGDIPHRRFQVLPPDPHNFDGDHDGVGCES
jgi:micrococcal nuclease